MDKRQAISYAVKECSICKAAKELDQFYSHKGRKDGKSKMCIECYKMRRRKYKNDPEKERERSRRYRESHIKERRASSRAYAHKHKKQRAAYNRQYQKENPEKAREKSQLYRKRHPERIKEYGDEYRATNRAVLCERTSKYAKAHPDRMRENTRRRRALKLKAAGSFTDSEFIDLCEQYNWICLCCKEEKPLAADHIVPLSRGGRDSIDNIQPLCKSCNSKKSARIIDYRTQYEKATD